MITLPGRKKRASVHAACALPSRKSRLRALVYPQDGSRPGFRLAWSSLGAMAAAHFWDSKPASQWTPEEIAELVANSPWAKQVSAQYRVAIG